MAGLKSLVTSDNRKSHIIVRIVTPSNLYASGVLHMCLISSENDDCCALQTLIYQSSILGPQQELLLDSDIQTKIPECKQARWAITTLPHSARFEADTRAGKTSPLIRFHGLDLGVQLRKRQCSQSFISSLAYQDQDLGCVDQKSDFRTMTTLSPTLIWTYSTRTKV